MKQSKKIFKTKGSRVGVGAMRGVLEEKEGEVVEVRSKGKWDIGSVTHHLSVERNRPKEAIRALEMMASGTFLSVVEEATGISYWGLVALRKRHEGDMAKRRMELAEEAFEMAEGLRQLGREKIARLSADKEKLDEVNIRDIVLPYSQVMNAGLMAMGTEQKIIVEQKGGKIGLEEARRAIEEARKEIRRVDGLAALPAEVVAPEGVSEAVVVDLKASGQGSGA